MVVEREPIQVHGPLGSAGVPVGSLASGARSADLMCTCVWALGKRIGSLGPTSSLRQLISRRRFMVFGGRSVRCGRWWNCSSGGVGGWSDSARLKDEREYLGYEGVAERRRQRI